MDEVRIHKYIADCGAMSRRSAEEAIQKGRVTVNGEPARIGMKIVLGIDTVELDGFVVKPADGKVYVMLYKPAGVVNTLKDEQNRPCVADYVKDIKARIYPVGRLDMYSEGLLILTNDGEAANKLMHPSKGSKLVRKIYHVKVRGEIDEATVKKLGEPIDIEGVMTMPAKVSIIERKNGKTTLKMELHEGKNRQIRRLCENCELVILKLKRVCVGELNIGTLSPGEWKYLNHNEKKYLQSL